MGRIPNTRKKRKLSTKTFTSLSASIKSAFARISRTKDYVAIGVYFVTRIFSTGMGIPLTDLQNFFKGQAWSSQFMEYYEK